MSTRRIAVQRIILGVVVISFASLWASGFQDQKPLDRPFSGFDSLNVRFIGNWSFGSSYVVAYDAGRSLVFCGSGGGVYILDVSTPSSPVKVSEAIHSRGLVLGLFYDPSNHRLYIAGAQGGLEIWDISNPSSPYKLGHYFTPGDAEGVYVSGNYAYVADGGAGLRIIDVSNPSLPTEVGYYVTPGYAEGVYVSGSYAYVADYDAGLRIINVLNPSAPIQVGYYDTPGDAEGVYVSGNYAYVADGEAGLQIYQYYGPGISEDASERLSQIRLLKNPVHKHIELLFSLPIARRMDLNLYNLLGQKIRTYQIKKGFQGRVKLSVNGLSAGIYFLRLEGIGTGVIKVVVVE